jgi:hypothetical protein
MTVVLTLAGLNYGKTDYMGRALRGYASADGRYRVHVAYPQAANAESILVGVANLDTALEEWLPQDEVVVLAH